MKLIEDIGIYKNCSMKELWTIFICCFLTTILLLLIILEILIAVVISIGFSFFTTILIANSLQIKKRNKPRNYFNKLIMKKLFFTHNNKYYSPYCSD